MLAVEACSLSHLCVKVFQKMQSDEQFDFFWQLVQRTREELVMNEPALQNTQGDHEDGGAEPSTIDSPKVYYRHMYYQCVHAAITTIQDRFHQEDYSMYSTLEQLLIKAHTDEDYSAGLQQFTELYGADFNKSELATQLQLLSCMDIKIAKESITFRDIHIHFQSLVDSQVPLLAQVARVVKFVLLMPATNAISERSASAMRTTRTYAQP